MLQFTVTGNVALYTDADVSLGNYGITGNGEMI